MWSVYSIEAGYAVDTVSDVRWITPECEVSLCRIQCLLDSKATIYWHPQDRNMLPETWEQVGGDSCLSE
jgi:hypothetical protein